MARLAGLVVPGMPRPRTQRGNRRHRTFFNDGDYAACVEHMAEWCGRLDVAGFDAVLGLLG
jgi:putative transposase